MYNQEKNVYTVMVNNSTNINKMNNHFPPSITKFIFLNMFYESQRLVPAMFITIMQY